MSTSKTTRDLSDAELEKVAGQFRLPSDMMRPKILQTLHAGPQTVGKIVAATSATQSNNSKHLSLLASAGIVMRLNSQRIAVELRLDRCVPSLDAIRHHGP